MISICVEPYCDSCPHFKPETEIAVDFEGNAVYTNIKCEEAEKCEKIYDYIKRAGEKNA